MLPSGPVAEKVGLVLSRVVVPLWILLGVVMKLESGNARNLPSNIVDFSRDLHLNIGTVLYTLIGLEIFAILTMLLIARLARPMAIFMLTAFCGILIGEMLKNAESCGCFGGSIKVEPWQMLLADGLLLAGVIAFGPRKPAGTANLAAIAGTLAVLLVGGLALSFGIGRALHGKSPEIAVPDVDPDGTADPNANPSPVAVPAYWYPKDVPSWVGKRWREIEIFQFMPRWPEGLDEGTTYVVFYSRTCSHCEEMFERDLILPLGAPVVAIEIPASRTQLTSAEAWPMPQVDASVTLTNLPLGWDWTLMTPPLALRVEDGVITCANEGDHKQCFGLQ